MASDEEKVRVAEAIRADKYYRQVLAGQRRIATLEARVAELEADRDAAVRESWAASPEPPTRTPGPVTYASETGAVSVPGKRLSYEDPPVKGEPLFRVVDAEGVEQLDHYDFFIDKDGAVWAREDDVHDTPHVEIGRRIGYRVEWLLDPTTGRPPRRFGV